MRLGTDVQTVLKQVQERQREFNRSVFWRDVREIAASLVVAAVFALIGVAPPFGGWPFYAAAALMLGVGLLMMVDRVRQRHLAQAFGESAKDYIERSLMQVNHQIRLLENVFWWYVLPCAIAYVLVGAHVVATASSQLQGQMAYRLVMAMVLGGTALGGTVFCTVYRMNRSAVRTDLVPRQEQLRNLSRALSQTE